MCVLVYRKHGNETLSIEEFPQNSTKFPVVVTVTDPELYKLAVIGKNNSWIDMQPVTGKMTFATVTPTPIMTSKLLGIVAFVR